MSSFKTEIFKSVTHIPNQYWQDLNCGGNVYYTPEFLSAFENANNDIDFNYVFVLKNKQAVAFGYTQLVTIGMETITKNIKISDHFKEKINSFFKASSPKVLFCGNVFLSGEYGTFLKQDQDKNETFKALIEAIKRLYKSLDKVSGVFVKDFKEESLSITNQLLDYSYTPMVVEPNMIITLKPEWESFEDYKADLKSKYRVKANKADTTSETLTAKLFTAKDIEQYKPQLQQLYQNTIANANFNAQILNLNTYTFLKETYGDNFIVKGYFLDDKLVGFLSAMVNGNNLDAHFIGLDYSLNREHAIYPRILNDYVRLGIEHGSQQINLGRTASEIKSTLGAKPQQLMCYARHTKAIHNKIVKPFIKNVELKSFKQHYPFKGEVTPEKLKETV